MSKKADEIVAFYGMLMDMPEDQALAQFKADRANWARAKHEARKTLESQDLAAQSFSNLPLQ